MEWSNIHEQPSFPPQDEDDHDDQHQVDWTLEENKIFETAIAEFGLDPPAFFNHVASRVPSKSMDQIKRHYECLVQDVEMMEAGLCLTPRYATPHHDQVEGSNEGGGEETKSEKLGSSSSKKVARRTCNGIQRKRGVPWTEEEHQLFLMGLNKYGKGDWRSIARNYVVTKTSTQVASHAQKFFRRQTTTTPTNRRRPSIHDIQTVDSAFFTYPHQKNIVNPIMITNELFPPQLPITSTPNGLTPMYNNRSNFFNNNGVLMSNFGNNEAAGFTPATSTFPVASFMNNHSHASYPSSSYRIP